ncbi:MAG TPA: peptidylprolyl isomerase [Candidatus Hydrogenedentes bacterium]|nr:peptidylprolyl isomerase [Candidatus Hydrogenedentota bacterium]
MKARFHGSLAGILVMIVAFSGCGFIADKDQIRVAKFKNRYITRGELAKVIRDMPDEDRIIKNRGDMLRILSNYIDEQIKIPLGQEVEELYKSRGQTLLPRSAAMQQYFQKHEEDNYAAMYMAQDPALFGMSKEQLDMAKEQMDNEIDELHEKLLGDAAVGYKAVEALKSGALTVTDAEYEQEYRLRKGEFKKLEWVKFLAIRFPAEQPGAGKDAAAVRKRIDAGESFDAIVEEFKAKDPASILESEIENNPNLTRFATFWLEVSGREAGEIVGPVFLPDYQVIGKTDAAGKQSLQQMPAVYMVLKVLDHRPEEPMSLEEAKPQLAPTILIGKMMAELRKQNGVEIYEKKLPDPAMFGERADKPF